MDNYEKHLLLTVARVLRAKVRNEIYAEQEDDYRALCDALAPYDPRSEPPVNEANDFAARGENMPDVTE